MRRDVFLEDDDIVVYTATCDDGETFRLCVNLNVSLGRMICSRCIHNAIYPVIKAAMEPDSHTSSPLAS